MGKEEGRFAQPSGFAVAAPGVRNLRDLRHRRFGQPVFVSADHTLGRKDQVAKWEKFNIRLAVVKFPDNVMLGYDPADLLLPTRYNEDGTPAFEIRACEQCQAPFSLTQQEVEEGKGPTLCAACLDG